jgi:hypothetical protein
MVRPRLRVGVSTSPALEPCGHLGRAGVAIPVRELRESRKAVKALRVAVVDTALQALGYITERIAGADDYATAVKHRLPIAPSFEAARRQ